jgi:thioredoxin-related protein
MNKLLALMLGMYCTLGALEWKSYEEALELQKKTNKLIMIDVVRDNCRFCTNMDRDVFEDQEMSVWLESRFIPVKLNLDHDKLPLGIQVHFTPTFYFIDNANAIKKKIPGSWNIEDFKSMTKDLK